MIEYEQEIRGGTAIGRTFQAHIVMFYEITNYNSS